jgi:hypothetical protein
VIPSKYLIMKEGRFGEFFNKKLDFYENQCFLEKNEKL